MPRSRRRKPQNNRVAPYREDHLMPDFLVSSATAVTIGVGLIISIVYLRYMWRALVHASDTLDDPDDGRPDAFAYSLAGAVVAVIASSLTITLYGVGPQFLYLGILLALLSPIAVAYTFHRELND
jgi:hypothetical protein